MKLRNSLDIFLFAAFSFITNLTIAHEGHLPNDKIKPIMSESILNLKSEWTTQAGQPASIKDFGGKPFIVAMIYTSCDQACPLIIEDLRKIENALSKKTSVRIPFLLFSFDTLKDTPIKLKAFAQSRKLDLHHWTLFNGNKNAVRELAAVLGIRYKKNANGDFDHSNVITLIDAEGLVVEQQIGLNQDPQPLADKALRLNSVIRNAL